MPIVRVLAAVAVLHLAAFAAPIIYVADFSDPHQFGTLDLGSGLYQQIGTSDAGEIFNGPGRSLYAFDENSNFLKVAPNGATTLVGNPGFTADEPAGLADGTIYTSDIATHILYHIDPSTGSATAVGPTGFVNPSNGIYVLTLVAGDTTNLYAIVEAVNPSTGDIINHAQLYQLNRSTGAPTFITNVSDDFAACASILNGTFYLFDFTGEVQTLNISTGVASPLYDLSATLNGINGIAEIATPEPSAWFMTAVATAVLLRIRRRRMR